MKVAHLGEAQLISKCARNLPRRRDVVVGIGDDCAVVRLAGTTVLQLLKVDAVVEEIHFRRDADPRQVGWKAVCRAISDIAAMGGAPAHALVTIALSPKMELSALEALYAGIRRACAKFDVALVGGETSRSPGPLFMLVPTVSVALVSAVVPAGAPLMLTPSGRTPPLSVPFGPVPRAGELGCSPNFCRICAATAS